MQAINAWDIEIKEEPMANQGRLVKVMFSLIAAMTLGAFILLTLEGKPIKPMDYSLSSELKTPLDPVYQALATDTGIEPDRWQEIEISFYPNHNSWNADTEPSGSLALDYHFVVSNGLGQSDGLISTTSRWTRQLACLDSDDSRNMQKIIKIALIGDPVMRNRTPKQDRQLEVLVSNLIRHCFRDMKIHWK